MTDERAMVCAYIMKVANGVRADGLPILADALEKLAASIQRGEHTGRSYEAAVFAEVVADVKEHRRKRRAGRAN